MDSGKKQSRGVQHAGEGKVRGECGGSGEDPKCNKQLATALSAIGDKATLDLMGCLTGVGRGGY